MRPNRMEAANPPKLFFKLGVTWLAHHRQVDRTFNSDRSPKSGVVSVLRSNPTITQLSNGTNVTDEIIERKVALICSYDEQQVMLSRRDYDLSQEQSRSRPTARHEFVTLSNRIILAVTNFGRQHPNVRERI